MAEAEGWARGAAKEARPACKKCGYAGHLTYQCRNFIRVDPERDVVLDVSSTSSGSEADGVTPLQGLRERELKDKLRLKADKDKHKEKKKTKRKRPHSDDDSHSDSDRDAKKSKKRKKEKKKAKKHKKKSRKSSTSDKK